MSIAYQQQFYTYNINFIYLIERTTRSFFRYFLQLFLGYCRFYILYVEQIFAQKFLLHACQLKDLIVGSEEFLKGKREE
jgi:hypothetical protein